MEDGGGSQHSGEGALPMAFVNGERLPQATKNIGRVGKGEIEGEGCGGGGDTLEILLVFPREDTQSLCFAKASERLGFSSQLATSVEAATDAFAGNKHDLVIIDRRAQFNADQLVKSLRAVQQAEFSTVVAVTKQGGPRPNIPLSDLVALGYDMKYPEQSSVDAAVDLLVTCHRNCFRWQQRICGFSAAFAALDKVADAVEITDETFRVQYVNSAHAATFNVTANEAVGHCSFTLADCHKSSEEIADIAQTLKGGQEWQGEIEGKPGDARQACCCTCVPVKGRRGRVQHFVSIKRPLLQSNQQQQQQQQQRLHRQQLPLLNSRKEADPMKRSRSEMLTPLRQLPNQRALPSVPSMPLNASLLPTLRARSGHRPASVTVEAPIHQVISLIGEAQDKSPPDVVTLLDKVLGILHRTTELYSGQLSASVEDKVTCDYVDGLMTGRLREPQKKRSLSSRTSSSSAIRSLREVPEQVAPFLKNDNHWEFDILELERATKTKPMVYLAMKTLNRFNVCQHLRCEENTMVQWLQLIQDNYHADNPYHNATHGADVMQSSAFFLERQRIKSIFDETDEVASLLGALVHDLDHPGKTNPFLINSQHRLALLYNDISVLESHHAALAFTLTTANERANIFKNLPRDSYKALRRSIVDVVLATEMAKHFEHVGKFTNQILGALNDGREAIDEDEVLEILTKPDNRTLIKRVLIKCSDISNQCRPLKLCREWSRRISEEYFQQTEEEKQLGLPIVMPVFDRATCNLPQSQISFIDFFLREMITAWDAFCDVPLLIEHMNNNYNYWKQMADEQSSKQQQQQQQRQQ